MLIGGIIGLGEAEEDRVGLLHTLATLPTHPESVPINALVAVKGTPLQEQKVILFVSDTSSVWLLL
jgi:biotin synthase